MSTLAEIEAAADALPIEQKQALLFFLAARLRQNGNLPEPRIFFAQQISDWISQDEADLRKFRGEP